MLHSTLPTQPSLTPHKPSASTPSLSSHREERESKAGGVSTQADAVPNGHLQTPCAHSPDRTVTDRASVQSANLPESSADPSCSCPDVSSVPPVSLMEAKGLSDRGVPRVCISAKGGKDDAREDSSVKAGRTEAQTKDGTTAAAEGRQVEASEKHRGPHQAIQEAKPPAEALPVSFSLCCCNGCRGNGVVAPIVQHRHLFSPQVSFPTSSSFTLEVETALESFDFLNCSDLEEEEEEDEEQQDDKGEKKEEDGQREENQNKMEEEKVEAEEHFYSGRRSVLVM